MPYTHPSHHLHYLPRPKLTLRLRLHLRLCVCVCRDRRLGE
jgi:hypothetical protein